MTQMSVNKHKNVAAFHGSDHKTGVTMLAQSVCMDICRREPQKSVMFVGMNKRPGCEYIKEDVCSIEDIKLHLDNRTLTSDEIKNMCFVRKNFYMLAGIRNFICERDFFPETAEYLLQTVAPNFDIIICDAGNDPDNGLSVGALRCSGQRYCILSQCESSLREFENRKWIFEKLGIGFDAFVLNKYFNKDPYDKIYISERLSMDLDEFITVRMAGYGRQAEMERQVLSEYRNDAFVSDIAALADVIMEKAGIVRRVERKRRLWKIDFI